MSIWDIAAGEDRDYITPEDIIKARESGYDVCLLRQEVLLAISYRKCEDYSLCAFEASKDDSTAD